jgi:hypothetical protein
MSEAKTLIFIQKYPCRGGASSRLLDTLAALRGGTPCDLHVVCSEPSDFGPIYQGLGVRLTVQPLPEWRKFWDRLSFPWAMRSLRNAMPVRRADWVISNEMWWAPHAAALARGLGAKSAAILRDGVADVGKALDYRLQLNDWILPSSMKIARALQSDDRLASRTRVFWDAVVLPPRQPGHAEELDRVLGTANHAVRRWLLVLGRVQERKCQADAVRVLHGLLKKGHDDLGLMIAGDCDEGYRPVMEAVIAQCGVEDRVRWLGNVTDVQAVFERCTASLLTSLREALPGSMMESCLAGRICFMYPCEGAEDIFGPYQSELVGEDFTPQTLIDQMDVMLRDPGRMQQRAADLQERARRLFSPQAHLRSCVELFDLDGLID